VHGEWFGPNMHHGNHQYIESLPSAFGQ